MFRFRLFITLLLKHSHRSGIRVKVLISIFFIGGLSTNLFGQTEAFKTAYWISPAFAEQIVERPCPIFQKAFQAKEKIISAKLYITAHGLYEAQLNGLRIGNAYFTPGFTDYHKRLQYQVYNITSLLRGVDTLKVTIGDGWYRGVFNEEMQANTYGNDASLLVKLVIRYTHGRKQEIVSDSTWQCATGPIRYADLYNGEIQDTRILEQNWTKVRVSDYPFTSLIRTISPAVTEHENFAPVKVFTTPKGEQVADFGQNMAGWVKLKIRGKAGDTIKVSHAEALDKDGDFYTGNLRDAKAEDIYILNGNQQMLEPHFSYHGFRYIRVTGCKLTQSNCRAIALYSDLQHTGSFSCSNPLINQLQHNIEWSLNSNFFDIPTDCPQRSERLGWTGDAQIFCSTAAYNRDVKTFYEKWLNDFSADQGVNGGMPVIIPKLNRSNNGGVAGWGDAATIIPWTLYEVYRDKEILKAQYPSMKAWVDHIADLASLNNYQWQANGYGDWYAPGPKTDITYIDQCFFAYSAAILVKAAKVMGNREDIKRYGRILDSAKAAFLKIYLNPEGRTQDTQTAFVLALQFDLLPVDLRQKAVDRLVALIHENHDHLATGFLGTPYLLPVLSKYGYTRLAYTLLNQTTMPSWLYPVTKGETTIWEKWDAIRPDGSLDTCSLNHYAYGAVGNWLYTAIAGINKTSPGYKTIRIQPQIGGGLTWVKATYLCSYGNIVSNWQIKNNQLLLHVEIPKGTKASVSLPNRPVFTVTSGSHNILTNL